MTKAQETIQALKVLLGMEKAPEVIESVFEVVKLADGSEINVDKMEVGGKTDKPEGEYEMEDGSKIVVDAEGMITEIKAKEVEAADMPVEDAPVEAQGGTPEERIAALEAQVAELTSLLQQIVSQFEKKTEEFSTQISEIADAPAATPITFTKEKEIPVEEMNAFQQFMHFRKLNKK